MSIADQAISMNINRAVYAIWDKKNLSLFKVKTMKSKYLILISPTLMRDESRK